MKIVPTSTIPTSLINTSKYQYKSQIKSLTNIGESPSSAVNQLLNSLQQSFTGQWTPLFVSQISRHRYNFNHCEPESTLTTLSLRYPFSTPAFDTQNIQLTRRRTVPNLIYLVVRPPLFNTIGYSTERI